MKKLTGLLLIAFLFFNCTISEKKPRLVVFISVDQLKPELLEKYDPLFTGGYRWLRDHATNFSNIHHEHSYKLTGPGHFVLASGRYPGPAGIIANYWWDRELQRSVSSVEDTLSVTLGDGGMGRSYRKVNTTALGDWLKEIYPGSKVFSLATKDRSAVLMGGKNPDLALWYNWQGSYTTSTYYAESLPEWVEKYNAEINILQYRDSVWAHTLPKSVYDQYARPDSFPGEVDRTDNGIYDPVLPFRFDKSFSDKEVLNDFAGTPWGDRATLRLALSCIQSQELGRDASPDIIFISLSANDMIGHDFGPYSQEMLDNLIKIDSYLMDFINAVENTIGKGQTLFVLSADHGAIPLPEYLLQQGQNAGRINKPEWKQRVKSAFLEIEQTFGPGLINEYGNFFYYNHAELEKMSIDKDHLTTIIRKHLIDLKGIEVILTTDEINNAPSTDPFFRRLKNMMHPTKSPDVWPIPEENWTFRWPSGSTHGTPYNYDTHVPLYISRAGQNYREVREKAATVDIAPTIAKVLGINIPDYVDGKPLSLW